MFILDIADNSIFLLVYGFIMQYIFRVSCPTILRACKNAAGLFQAYSRLADGCRVMDKPPPVRPAAFLSSNIN